MTFSLTAAAQSFPQSVDLVQRIDQLYPWLNIVAFDADADGNIYLAGSSIGPIPDAVNIRVGPLGGGDIVVIKFDPLAQRMVYGVAIGGSAEDNVRQIRVDSMGSVYLLAATQSTDFPLLNTQESRGGSVILKLGSTGRPLYSTNLGGADAEAFDIDSTGAVYFGGMAVRGELPTSPGSYSPDPPLESFVPGFMAKLDGIGQLVAVTYVVATVSHVLSRTSGDVLLSMGDGVGALDGSLSHQLFSIGTGVGTFPTDFPPEGSIDIGLDDQGNIYVAGLNAIHKYSADGQTLLFSRDVKGAGVFQIAVAHSGLVYYVGGKPSNVPPHNATQACNPDLPSSISGVLDGGWFLWVIGPDGETRYATYMAEHVALLPAKSVWFGNGLYALAEATLAQDGTHWRGIVRLNPDEIPGDHISAACLLHGGTLLGTPVTPGTIMTLIGSGLGPQDGASYVLQNGRVPFSLSGTSLRVDGKPVPILYAQDGQIEFVTPFSLRTDRAIVPVCATFGSATSCLNVLTFAVDPGFYYISKNVIAAINQDGTINSQDHPAKGGGYISVYFTGGGALDGTVIDGDIAGLELHRLTAGVSASIGFCILNCVSTVPIDTPVLFAGAVPTLVYGANVAVVQIPPAPAGIKAAQLTLQFLSPDGTVDSDAAGDIFVTP